MPYRYRIHWWATNRGTPTARGPHARRLLPKSTMVKMRNSRFRHWRARNFLLGPKLAKYVAPCHHSASTAARRSELKILENPAFRGRPGNSHTCTADGDRRCPSRAQPLPGIQVDGDRQSVKTPHSVTEKRWWLGDHRRLVERA